MVKRQNSTPKLSEDNWKLFQRTPTNSLKTTEISRWKKWNKDITKDEYRDSKGCPDPSMMDKVKLLLLLLYFDLFLGKGVC